MHHIQYYGISAMCTRIAVCRICRGRLYGLQYEENEQPLYFNNIFNFTEKMLLIILRLNLILLWKAVGYIP